MSPADNPDIPDIDLWLRNGGLVVTGNDRAARALRQDFHRRRRAEGFTAWQEPQIQDWASFTQAAWEARSVDGRMVLNPAQEQSIWAGIVAQEAHLAALLPGPRYRLANLVMQGYGLLCGYSPRHLQTMARNSWSLDPGIFSAWLTTFEAECRALDVLSASRVALEAIPLLEADHAQRPPILTVGFDRMQPVQHALLTAWGSWQPGKAGAPAQHVQHLHASNLQQELDACAHWCMQLLGANPEARVLVISREVAEHRGAIERAFLRHAPAAADPVFEFSLGIPLSQATVPRAYLTMLRWLDGALEETAVDWLLATGFAAQDADESAALQACMRWLRRAGLQRPAWTLDAFARQRIGGGALPAAWIERTLAAREHLLAAAHPPRHPLEWAALVPELLNRMRLTGERRFSSADYQAARRWEQALDTCGSLGFNGRHISWQDFLAALARIIEETLFAPESIHAPIQITGPVESAGLLADAIWFLGADEDSWPATGSAHPLLPLQVQRDAAMPHASPLHDWELAQSITVRLLASAPIVHFSYALQKNTMETRPSRIVLRLAGPSTPLPGSTVEPIQPHTIRYHDTSHIPLPAHRAHGGAGLLSAQSQCPFKAFATTRLDAQDWEPAEPGLNAMQRGQLLHHVMHAVWGGPPHGLSNLDDLHRRSDLAAFVAHHVRRTVAEKLPEDVRNRMPRRYLALEEQRLVQLVTEWLGYEARRLSFHVEQVEAPAVVQIAGLTLKLRLDRIDCLNDGSLLVIDYKTGSVSIRDWELPRPQDVQLPLYATFALPEPHKAGGLVLAQVQTGKSRFAGCVTDPSTTLFGGLKGSSLLMKHRLTDDQLSAWRETIEQLARDYLAGDAAVDPRKYPETCVACGLQTLCRIQEQQPSVVLEEEEPEADDD